MKIMLILVLSLIGTTIKCEETPDDKKTTVIIKELGNEDFDKRQAASAQLEKYPVEYIKKFIDIALTESDPEIRERLFSVAWAIFVEKELPNDESWQFLMGSMDIDSSYVWSSWQSDVPEGEPRQRVLGMMVRSTWGECDGKLQEYDFIVEVDGEPVKQQESMFRAGKEYELTVKRTKDLDETKKRGTFDPDTEEFTLVKVKVKASQKQLTSSWEIARAYKLRDELWEKYKEKIHPKPAEPKAEENVKVQN